MRLGFKRNQFFNIPYQKDLTNLRIVIAFSLYGNAERYFGGLLENCRQINEIYPNFWIYVYLGNDFDRSIMNGKFDEFKNLMFIETGKSGHEVMSYRFFAIDRPEVGIAFSRDLDSRINLRDQYCINQFIKSPRRFQIIRDNIMHGIRILGGMWGIKKGMLSFKIQSSFNTFRLKTPVIEHGTDQDFLGEFIYPIVRFDSLVFDEYFHYSGETPMKIQASGQFVGECVF